ncbi:nucleophile aminohydrolase [Nemania sp. FL0916]|nr:nucleophile aminohydrolase [Nemania sp. FL0916]
MSHGPHSMVAGKSSTDNLASLHHLDKVDNAYFATPSKKAYWKQRSELTCMEREKSGTVGAVVLDASGQLAAAGSTGGPTGKLEGRIGDTAILGAGLYADAHIAVVWYVYECLSTSYLNFKLLLCFIVIWLSLTLP